MSGMAVAGGAIGAVVALNVEQQRRRERLGIKYCYQCGHEWVAKNRNVQPKLCPLCKSPKWNDNSVRENKLMKRFKKFLFKTIIVIFILSIIIYIMFPVGGLNFLPILWIGGMIIVGMQLMFVVLGD